MKKTGGRILLFLLALFFAAGSRLPPPCLARKPCCKPDLDCDGSVGDRDTREIWERQGCREGQLCYDADCDFDRNGRIDLQDTLIISCWYKWTEGDDDRPYCDCVPKSKRCEGNEGPSPPKHRGPSVKHVYFPMMYGHFCPRGQEDRNKAQKGVSK